MAALACGEGRPARSDACKPALAGPGPFWATAFRQSPSRRPLISFAVPATRPPHSDSRSASYRESGIETATAASGVPLSSSTGAARAQTPGRY